MKSLNKVDILVTDKALDPESCRNFVQTPDGGAEVVFVGSVRNQTKGKFVVRLYFEAYEPMASQEMEKIAVQASDRWDILKIAIHHRTGNLEIGELPVVIAVSSAHRKESFAACQYCIDSLKKTVPIWKKEIFEDGEIWVEAHP